MPYRRSRLQDYYEELLGPDPSDGGSPAEPEAEESQPDWPWYYSHIFPPSLPEPTVDEDTPEQPTPPTSQSIGQASSSDSDKESSRGSDKSRSDKGHQKPDSSQPSTSDFPQDIEWSPEDEPSGIVPFVQAAAVRTRDSSEDKSTVVCEALYAADPEGVARGVKIMTGAELDAEEDILGECIRLARSVGLDDYLAGVEGWYTTRLGSSESFAATVTEEAPLSGLSQPLTETGADEVPEINIFAQHYLSETESGWDRTWTEKEKLENNVLIPNLKRFIHGFDENSVNWDDFTLLESLDFYSHQMAGELMALSQNPAASDEYYQQIHAELDWVTELRSLAEPKALDYTEVYAQSFAGRVHVPDGEHVRRHVVDQITLIHDELNITVPDTYFESRSTRELMHDLAYLLQDEVLPFLNADENEEDNRIGDFYRRYQLIARDTPENVLRRLVSSYQKPDLVGFFFMMGFLAANILYEPIDWAATSVDVTDALLRGDKESAKQHFFFGAMPFLKSGMVRALKRLGRTPLGRLLPARIGMRSAEQLRKQGFTSAQIEAIAQSRIVAPGSKSELHKRLDAIDSRRPDERLNVRWYDPNSPENTISGRAENDIGELFKGLDYNVIIKPTDTQLAHPEIAYKGTGKPDYIIEGKVFDAYAPNTNNLRNIASTIEEKLESGQADRLIVDITESTVTEGDLAKQFKEYGDGMLYNLNKGTDLRELWLRKNDQLFPFLTVENSRIRMLWP